MPTKYDTNPLDPDFPEKAKTAAAGEVETTTLPYTAPETQKFSAPAPTEEQTRRFADVDVKAYSEPYGSPFNGQYVPAQYAPTGIADMGVATSPNRRVPKVGMPEKWLITLPYIPFSIGLVAGLILLLVIQKDEAKVRFHAAQGLAAHVGILIVSAILGLVDNVTDIADVGNAIFTAVTTIMLIIFAVRSWKGKPVHIESVESLTNWLEEKVGPVTSK